MRYDISSLVAGNSRVTVVNINNTLIKVHMFKIL